MGLLDSPDYADMTFDTFIGNVKAVKMLQIAAQSALMRDEPLPHTLLAGGSGNGKTTLAVLLARKMGSDVHTISGKMKIGEFRVAMSQVGDKDIIFIDEAHTTLRGADYILNAMQDGVLLGPWGEEEIAPCTFIAATTDAGKIPVAILNRFQLIPPIVDYTDEEAFQIAKGQAGKVFGAMPIPTTETIKGIVQAANNNPRTIKMLLANLRDVAIVEGHLSPKQYDLAQVLDLSELTPDGLDRTAVRYLATLMKHPNGLGAKAVAEILDEGGGVAHVETVLQKKGYLLRMKTGRTLTTDGLRRAKDFVR